MPGVDKERQVCTSPLTLCPSKLNTLLAFSKILQLANSALVAHVHLVDVCSVYKLESLILGGKVPGVDEERQVCTSPLTLCPSTINTLLALSNKQE